MLHIQISWAVCVCGVEVQTLPSYIMVIQSYIFCTTKVEALGTLVKKIAIT